MTQRNSPTKKPTSIPRKPGTAQNMRDHATKHRTKSMSTKISDVNSKKEADERRKEAIGGKTIDEEHPASFRKKGDPITTKETDVSEGRHQGGVLRKAFGDAEKLGLDTVVSHGIKGDDLEKYAPKDKKGRKRRKRSVDFGLSGEILKREWLEGLV